MSRVINLSLDEGVVVIRCMSEHVGISAIEGLPGGGVRLVCASPWCQPVPETTIKVWPSGCVCQLLRAGLEPHHAAGKAGRVVAAELPEDGDVAGRRVRRCGDLLRDEPVS